MLSGIVIIHFDDMQKINPFTYLPNKMSIWSVIEKVWGDPHQDKSHRITGCQTAILLNMGGSCFNLQTLLHIQKMEGENTGCERKVFKIKTDYPLIKYRNLDIIEVKEK